MLDELISPEAAALYQRLLERGSVPVGEDGSPGLCVDDEHVQELERLGLVIEVVAEQRLVPQAPITAFQHLLAGQQQRIDGELATLAQTYRQLEQAQRSYTRSADVTGGQSQLARVLTDPDEMSAWADHLRYSADWECLMLETAPPPEVTPAVERLQDVPVERQQRGVRVRSVYAREWLERSDWAGRLPAYLEQSAEQARFLSGMTLRMRIADDHTALVGLMPRALEGSLLIQAPHFVAALRQLFEYFWAQAEPLARKSPCEADLTSTQQEVLRLLAAGLKDDAIARSLDISVKTVRRHIANLLHRLNTDTRFAAGAEALRRGWLN